MLWGGGEAALSRCLLLCLFPVQQEEEGDGD